MRLAFLTEQQPHPNAISIMTRRVGIRCILAVGLMSTATAAFAGAWTLDAGTGELIITGTAMQATSVFDSNSKLQSIPRYSKEEAQALIEYGVTNWFTAMFQPSLQHVNIAAPFGAERGGLGYTDIGGRARIWSDDSWVVSAQATFRIPGVLDKTNPAAIGYTDPEIDIRGLVGYSFKAGTLPAFIDVEVAQRFRLGGPPDEFRTDITFGIRPVDRWLFLAQSFNVVSEGAGTWGFGSFAYHKFQLSAVYALTPTLSLQLGGYSTYWGRDALQENGLVVGAWYKF
jgi:protein XagA